MIEVKNTLNGKLNASIVKEYPELEEITVTPTLEGQELEPSKYGYSKITIKAIPATNITVSPTEEQQNLQGIFKEVNINPIQAKEITTDLDFSSTDTIELTAQEGAYIKKATINKDANLTPENIKSGVIVNGIAGDVADTSDADATSDDIVVGKTAYVANEKIQGTYEPLDTSDATATAEDIAKNKTAYVNGEKIIGTLDVSNIDNQLYQRVNYIESNGQQYIDTGVLPVEGTSRVTIDYQVTEENYSSETGAEHWIFGQWDKVNGKGYRCGASISMLGSISLNTNSGFSYMKSANNKADYLRRQFAFSDTCTITTNYPMILFAQQEGGIINHIKYSYFKLFGCKIYRDDTIIRDFIPCYRKADNVAGLLDAVNNIFYRSQGSSDFIAGDNVGQT